MSEKVLEKCEYCDENHLQDKEPFTINGIPIKECPNHPQENPQMTFINKSRFTEYVNEWANRIQAEAERENINRIRGHWDYLFNRAPNYKGIE
jgi:hypothetical protein